MMVWTAVSLMSSEHRRKASVFRWDPCTADIGAPPRCIKFRDALPDERLKFLVGHAAELIYMRALGLFHVEPHEFAALHFRGDGRAQLTHRPCRVSKSLELLKPILVG